MPEEPTPARIRGPVQVLLCRVTENMARDLSYTVARGKEIVEPFTRLADQVKERQAQLPELTPHG